MRQTWIPTRLSEILTPISRAETVDSSKEYCLLGIRLDGGGPFHRESKIGSQISATTLFRVKAGDFLYSRLFAWRGAFGVINPEFDDFYVSGEFPAFKPKAGKLDIQFLRLWFRLPSTLSTVVAKCTGSTPLTRNRFKEPFFLQMELPLPPLSEQRRIVATIEEVATKIKQAQELRREASNEIGVLINSFLRQFFNSAEEYPKIALEKACVAIIDNLHSNPVYADEGIPCIRSSDVGWGKLNLDTARKTTEEEYVRRTVRGEPSVDDIVLVREGGGTGKAAVVEEGQRFSLGQRVMMLRPNKSLVLPRFFLYQLLSPAIYNDQILQLSKGSASPHLNISALRKFTFILPPLREQRRIVAYLDNILAKVDAMKHLQFQTAAELDALLPSVLDKAFKGKL